MKPIDFRDKNFVQIRTDLAGRLQEVYTAWVCHGPCTTRQLADKSGIDILNVRPRTTDLVGIGLVEVMSGNAREGVYGVRNQQEWESWAAAQRASVGGQLALI